MKKLTHTPNAHQEMNKQPDLPIQWNIIQPSKLIRIRATRMAWGLQAMANQVTLSLISALIM
jgi:hypothetical protein